MNSPYAASASKRFFKKMIPWAICLLMGILAGCSSTETRKGKLPVSLPPIHPPVVTKPITEPTIPSTSIIETNPAISVTPIKTEPETEIGWLLTRRDPKTAAAFLEKATDYQITHLQLSGNILTAVDDLILKPDVSRFVRSLAQQARPMGIRTYVWSRELHLEGKTFTFNWSAPLIAARQAAYRNALTSIPEIEGVVLSFDQAELEPWDAVIPEGQPAQTAPERIRFVLDMIRKVVVDELGKRLLVSLDAATPEQQQWIAQALEGYPAGSVSILKPVYFPARSQANASPLSMNNNLQPQWIECDLIGADYFGDRFLYCLADELSQWFGEARRLNLKGGAAHIDAKSYSLFDSPNEINLYLFSQFLSNIHSTGDRILEDWIQRRYGLPSGSPESQVMKRYLRASAFGERKMCLVKGLPAFVMVGDVPQDRRAPLTLISRNPSLSDSSLDYVKQELASPKKQTLIDISQEAYEVCEWLSQGERDLETLRPKLNPTDYDKLRTRLDYQHRVADVFFYAKQALWGYLLWEQTLDEPEALHLEANLQRLEQAATELEQKYGIELYPANPRRIRALTADLRRTFPHVLLGAVERKWNRLKNFSLKPSGSAGVEISWESETPSQSRVFAGKEPMVFALTVPGSGSPTTNHRVVVDGLSPGSIYYFKVQCTTEKGDITNSGAFAFYLENQPAL